MNPHQPTASHPTLRAVGASPRQPSQQAGVLLEQSGLLQVRITRQRRLAFDERGEPADPGVAVRPGRGRLGSLKTRRRAGGGAFPRGRRCLARYPAPPPAAGHADAAPDRRPSLGQPRGSRRRRCDSEDLAEGHIRVADARIGVAVSGGNDQIRASSLGAASEFLEQCRACPGRLRPRGTLPCPALPGKPAGSSRACSIISRATNAGRLPDSACEVDGRRATDGVGVPRGAEADGRGSAGGQASVPCAGLPVRRPPAERWLHAPVDPS